MKKLIITRFAGLLICLLWAIITAFISFLLNTPTDDSELRWYIDLSYASGIIPLCFIYFFAGKRFHDVSIKKLTAIFFIWTLVVLGTSVFINQYLLVLSGGYSCFSAYIDRVGITENRYLVWIISFLVEMAIFIIGIFMGRIKSGKIKEKYVIFLSKFCGVIIGYVIVFFVSSIFVVVSPKAPLGYLANEGAHLGWIISMLPVALWYIYAGFKSFHLNLKITLPIFLLWDALGIFLWRALKMWDLFKLCGGYVVFFNGIGNILNGKHMIPACIFAYILETLFMTAGVLLGRHFNKKKVLPEEIAE